MNHATGVVLKALVTFLRNWEVASDSSAILLSSYCNPDVFVHYNYIIFTKHSKIRLLTIKNTITVHLNHLIPIQWPILPVFSLNQGLQLFTLCI